MDTRRLILSITIMMVVVMGWELAVSMLNKAHPDWGLLKPTPTSQPTTQDSESTAIAPTLPGTTAAVAPAVATTGPTTAPTGLYLMPAAMTKSAEVGSPTHQDKTYAVDLRLDPQGAGIAAATLNDFYDTADKKTQQLYTFQQPLAEMESSTRPLATKSITIDGVELNLEQANWTLASSDEVSATYVLVVATGGLPLVEIDKTFTVQPRSTRDGSGFETTVTENFRNLSGKSLKIKSSFGGPTMPPRESDRSEDRQFIAGYDDDKEIATSHVGLTDFTHDVPTKDLTQIDQRPLLWFGASSAYFDAIIRPEPTSVVKMAAVVVGGLNLDAPAENRLVDMTIQTNEFKLDAGAAVPLNLKVFFGPKQRALLKNDYYAAFPLSYDKTLVTSGGMCGFLTFQPLINLLYGILWFFHMIFRDWGIAIICLVGLVRSLLHPITRKSQVNMMQMSKMGPEIERLKKKHGDNKDELNKAMMEFYKTQGFTPVLGCLPMFLQMPIWIALWSALQSTFELRQAPFLRFGWLHLTWIKDLSHPDFLVHFATPIPLLFGWTLHGINVLPLLLAVVFFFQQKFQPQPANMTPEQQQQRKMMQWMSLLFPVMLYAGPSGLNLYILTSTSIGIIESKIIRDHIKEREEAEKAGRIFVDAKPTRGSKRRDSNEPSKPEKKTGIMGWLADLQAKAEEVRREAERRKG